VTRWWYTDAVATSHPRIQVTEDPELARALRAAAPHLSPGLPRSQQVRELAIVGAQHLAEEPSLTEERRQELLEQLMSDFRHPETAPWDWDVLRDVKKLAWRYG
jgi:FPC/CPF motif-containing protein YcgG